MLAVQEGHDGIVFATGQQNADLYDLSKQVDQLLYRKNADGTYYLSAITGGTGNPMGESISADKLEDYVGKEVAKKIVDGEGWRTEVQGKYDSVSMTSKKDYMMSLSGDGLKVGGEGMIAYYDTIIPNETRKVLKQLGAGDTAIEKIDTMANGEALSSEEKRRVAELQRKEKRTTSQQRELDMFLRSQADAALPQPGFRIPPALRERVGEGVPMFSEPRFTPDLDEKAEFVRALDSWVGMPEKFRRSGQPLVVGSTPYALLQVKADQHPIQVDRDTLIKLVREHGDDPKGHGLTLDQVKNMPDQLADPIAIFESSPDPKTKQRRSNGRVVLTTLTDSQGDQAVVAIHLSKISGRNHVINDVSSMHGRTEKEIEGWVNRGLTHAIPHNSRTIELISC